MARVASGHLLVSVPREPLWRGLNMARGAYLRDLGNTPGHVNHWSKRGFVQLLSRYGVVEEARSPFPWTMLLVRVSLTPTSPERSAVDARYASGARILTIGIAATGVFTFAYFAVARHVLDEDDYGAISTLWAILFVTISVIYRPVEQLLSRTIADARARGVAPARAARRRDDPAGVRGRCSSWSRSRCTRRCVDKAFNGSDALYWILVGATLAYAGSYFARGYLAGHHGSGSTARWSCSSRCRGSASPSPSPWGSPVGRPRWRSGILAAPLASLLVVPWAIRRHAGGTSRRGRDRASRRGFAVAVAAIQLAEQTLVTIGVLLIPDAGLRGIVFNALLIARAPLQLFQAVQTSLLPHLAGIEATEGRE